MLHLFEGHPSQYYFDQSELNFKVLMEPNWQKKPLIKKLNEFLKNKFSNMEQQQHPHYEGVFCYDKIFNYIFL
jgi:hypothetical protein